MKWREVRNHEPWPTGPEESNTIYCARKGGVTYEVWAAWADPWKRAGRVIWWLSDGVGNNHDFDSKDAAMAAAESLAGV